MTAPDSALVPELPAGLGAFWGGLVRRLRRHPRQGVQLALSWEMMGNTYGGYAVDPSLLGAHSVVYSFGIGEDLSFDLALIERFGLQVHAFDPTPRSIAWARAQTLPSQLLLHELGLADYDGTASFDPPLDPTHISHTLLERKQSRGDKVTVQVRRLATIARELGHTSLDVLKMDIEGAEYGVIEKLEEEGVTIRQLLVEFHHHLPEVALSTTEGAIDRLNDLGFRIFHVSATGREFSLLRT